MKAPINSAHQEQSRPRPVEARTPCDRPYKDSGIEWIGRIPEGWKVAPIKRSFSLFAGATPKSDVPEYWDGGIPWITPADYCTENVEIDGGKRTISQRGMDSCATTLLPIGSIVFSKRAPIGLVVMNSKPLCTNQGCIGCVPNSEVSSRYYYFVMSVFSEQFELYGAGTTFKEISATSFANFLLPVPTIADQQRIASYLDTRCAEIDSLISLQEQMIERLKAYKQSVITEAVTRGLDPNAKLVPSGIDWIGDIPEGWKITDLKRLCSSITDGSHFSPERQVEGMPYITAADVRGKGIDYDNAMRISLDDYKQLESQGCRPHKGDVLLVKDGATTGRVGMMIDNEKCVLLSSVAMLTPKEDIDSDYLMYLIQSDVVQARIKLLMAGSAMPRVTLKKINSLMGLLISLPEQHAIASYLDTKCADIDRLIALKQQKIVTLKDYKKSVIYEAVTGKTEISSV